KVDIPNKKTEDGGDFWQINPKGYVPALQLDNGEVLTEVAIICQYLADQKSESGLDAKAGTMARYHEMEALNFVASEIHKQIGALFNPNYTPEMRDVQKAVIDRRLTPLEKKLANQDYIAGDAYTAADAYLFTVLNWTGKVGVDLGKYPKISALKERVGARTKVRETLEAEGLV
ncbi:MAG: glutathione binding-like protein, partial [Janthinobacterium lividum]